MKMAWIGMLDEHGVLKPVASCGSIGVDAGDSSLLANKDAPQFVPSHRALRKDQPFWCQDYQNDPSISACHKVSVRLGWGACAALPLHRNGELVGTFSLYADEQDAFDESVRNLLLEMAADIDFALNNFERDSRRERAESELDNSNKLLNTVIDTAPMRIFWKDAELRYLGCNTAFARDAGEDSPQDLLGKNDYQLAWKDEAELYRADDSQVMESGLPKLFYDEPQTTPDGKVIWLRTSKVPLRNAANETIGVLGIYEDITERKQTEVALQRSEANLNRAQAVAQVGSWSIDIKTNRLEWSDESFRIFGVPKRDVVDLDTFVAVIHPDDRERVLKTWNDAVIGAPYDIEHRVVADGQVRWVRERAEIERNTQGQALFGLGTVRDITERKLAEERIQYLAHFDVLTGLPNRTQLDDRIKYAISLAKRNNGKLVVMFLDLDRFKDINDTLGHSIGDALLIELAGRLPTVLREEDTVSRFGGDEFIIMLPNSDLGGVTQVAQKLLDIIARPYRIETYDLNVTASIGIAMFPDDGSTLEMLSKNADTAMYKDKREGRNSYSFFTADMQAHSTRNLQLVNALRHALEKGQLHLVYQPQLSMHDGRIIGAEALLRWQHPELGMISPAEFIPVAEDSGLILPIGEWVLRQAVRQVKAWMDEGLAPLIVAVNLSAVQFHHPNLPELVTRVLEEECLPPEYLELELTEGGAMDNPQGAIAFMNKLHERGIKMSIDDFGTGYSSLSYLKKFKVYKLKIDQSFVRDISTDAEDKAIVSAVISMAKSLGLQTIAEGVETVGQLAFLREQGCDEIQGYYYSKPLAPEQFRAYVKNSISA
jgi:diguanylate cyclase (GGDEF)-like protein/PAS domain S-box-containing protein